MVKSYDFIIIITTPSVLLFLLSAQLTHHRSLVPFVKYTHPGQCFCAWSKAHRLLVGTQYGSPCLKSIQPLSTLIRNTWHSAVSLSLVLDNTIPSNKTIPVQTGLDEQRRLLRIKHRKKGSIWQTPSPWRQCGTFSLCKSSSANSHPSCKKLPPSKAPNKKKGLSRRGNGLTERPSRATKLSAVGCHLLQI